MSPVPRPVSTRTSPTSVSMSRQWHTNRPRSKRLPRPFMSLAAIGQNVPQFKLCTRILVPSLDETMDDAEPHAPPRSQHSRRTRLTRCVSARCVALKVHIHRLHNHMKRIAGAEFNTPFRLLALQSCEVMCQIACEYLSKRHETRAGTAAHHMMRAVTIISSAQLTRSFVVDDHPAYSTSWLEAC